MDEKVEAPPFAWLSKKGNIISMTRPFRGKPAKNLAKKDYKEYQYDRLP